MKILQSKARLVFFYDSTKLQRNNIYEGSFVRKGRNGLNHWSIKYHDPTARTGIKNNIVLFQKAMWNLGGGMTGLGRNLAQQWTMVHMVNTW